jgi:hypothetical protein
MFNFTIWLRGLIVNHLLVCAILFWLVVLAVALGLAIVIYQQVRRGKPPALTWKIILGVILSVSLFLDFAYPGATVMFWMFIGSFNSTRFYAFRILAISLNIIFLGILLLPKKIQRRVWRQKKLARVLPFIFAYLFTTLALFIYILVGFYHFHYGRTLWPAVKMTSELTQALKVDGNLPHSQQELAQRKPTEVRNIKNYGRFCYFYDEVNNDFTIVTKFAGYWHIYNRQHDRLLVTADNEVYSDWLKKCRF